MRWPAAAQAKDFNAEECRKLAVYFASKVRQEVARDISKSVLSKSRLHKLQAFMEKFWDRNVHKV